MWFQKCFLGSDKSGLNNSETIIMYCYSPFTLSNTILAILLLYSAQYCSLISDNLSHIEIFNMYDENTTIVRSTDRFIFCFSVLIRPIYFYIIHYCFDGSIVYINTSFICSCDMSYLFPEFEVLKTTFRFAS